MKTVHDDRTENKEVCLPMAEKSSSGCAGRWNELDRRGPRHEGFPVWGWGPETRRPLWATIQGTHRMDQCCNELTPTAGSSPQQPPRPSWVNPNVVPNVQGHRAGKQEACSHHCSSTTGTCDWASSNLSGLKLCQPQNRNVALEHVMSPLCLKFRGSLFFKIWFKPCSKWL